MICLHLSSADWEKPIVYLETASVRSEQNPGHTETINRINEYKTLLDFIYDESDVFTADRDDRRRKACRFIIKEEYLLS